VALKPSFVVYDDARTDIGHLEDVLRGRVEIHESCRATRKGRHRKQIDWHDYSALIILGSSLDLQSIYDTERKWLEDAFGLIPILAVCHGAQLLSQVCNENKQWSYLPEPHQGLHPIRLVNDDPIFEGFQADELVYQSHSCYFDPPANTTPLAMSCGDSRQEHCEAFRVNSVQHTYGIQFHPESTQGSGKHILESWAMKVFDE
jgi:GMP synthase-like glutamine amidotransferase